MSAPIQLTRQQQETLARLAAQSGKPWEEVFHEAMTSFQMQTQSGNGDTSETVHQAMVRLGLLGCVHDAPADLSTNSSYMEGFGTGGW